MTLQPNRDEELYQDITYICFENGGVTKSMADKLYERVEADRTHTLQAISHYFAIPVEDLKKAVEDYKGDE